MNRTTLRAWNVEVFVATMAAGASVLLLTLGRNYVPKTGVGSVAEPEVARVWLTAIAAAGTAVVLAAAFGREHFIGVALVALGVAMNINGAVLLAGLTPAGGLAMVAYVGLSAFLFRSAARAVLRAVPDVTRVVP